MTDTRFMSLVIADRRQRLFVEVVESVVEGQGYLHFVSDCPLDIKIEEYPQLPRARYQKRICDIVESSQKY